MKDIILWCNENEGFISAVLTAMTILLSVIGIFFTYKIGKIPYKKKISVIPFYYKKNNQDIIELQIVNYGMMPYVICDINIEDETGLSIGGVQNEAPIVIEPSKYFRAKIPVSDENGVLARNSLNLNGHIKIKLWKYDNSVICVKNGFPVG